MMINNEKEYSELWHKAYNTAMYVLRNHDDSQDIAQLSTIKYYLKQDSIEKPFQWISTVAKHAALKMAKQQNKICELNPDYLVDQAGTAPAIDLAEYTDTDYEPPADFTNTAIDVKELLDKSDYKVYKSYLNCKTNIHKFAKKMNITYRAATSLMYKIKRNLRAAKLQKEGYRGTKKIIDYNTNRKIVTFIKTLVKKLNENDLQSLHKYLEFCEDKDAIKNLSKEKIIQTFDYNIEKKENNTFFIVVPYLLESNIMEFMQILFKVDNFKYTKILKCSIQSNKVAKLNITKKKLFDTYPKFKKGNMSVSKTELNKIIDI